MWPILFIIYVNGVSDFFTGSSVTVKLYADDAELYPCIQCEDDMYSLQLALDFAHNWSLAWQLSLSVTKCTVLQVGKSLRTGSYTINNISLSMCHKTRDLDIFVDSEISFKEHIYNIAASANQLAFLIKKYFLSMDTSSLVKAFKVYVRQLVEYCSPVRSPSNTG